MIKDRKAYRILVIEDNPGDLAIVEDFLAEQILDPFIVHAGSFKQASAILSAADILFDVILLDLSLADKSGQDLITEMLRVALSCPVIILSGYADIDFSIKSISQGILDYLFKDDLNAITLYKSIIYAIERKKTISDLQESEKRYSDLFHLSPQPMWVFDPQTFKFVQVNKAAIDLYGYSEEEFLSMTIKDITYGEDAAFIEEAKASVKAEEVYFSRENYRHRKKNGEIIQVEIQENVIFFKGEKANIVVAFDITEKTKYVNTIEDQNKKLREIAWMQSHVVRAPLSRMMLLIDMIKTDSLANDNVNELLNNVLISATELDNVIRDISNKISNGSKPEPKQRTKFEVLIIDDDKIITLVHKKMILKSNFHTEPLSFINGKEALDYILDNNSTDKTYCILLDINMPLMNGWEFLDVIDQHKIEAQIFVFMITSSVDKVDKDKAKTYPLVIDFLEKPISLKTLEGLKKHEPLRIFFDA